MDCFASLTWHDLQYSNLTKVACNVVILEMIFQPKHTRAKYAKLTDILKRFFKISNVKT